MKKTVNAEEGKSVESTRKDSNEKYGTWFPVNATPEVLVTKCNQQIANCNKWLLNLEALKVESEAIIKTTRFEALKSSLKDMSPEEKELIQSLLKEE